VDDLRQILAELKARHRRDRKKRTTQRDFADEFGVDSRRVRARLTKPDSPYRDYPSPWVAFAASCQ
jgi:hypothetical protein